MGGISDSYSAFTSLLKVHVLKMKDEIITTFKCSHAEMGDGDVKKSKTVFNSQQNKAQKCI